MEHKTRRDMILMTTTTLSKWGNSIAIRIPNQLLKHLDLEEGSEVEMIVTSEKEIILRPLIKPEETNEELRDHLSMLLSKIKTDSPRHNEVDLGIEGDELI
ncbi:AbrB/MazE/SpoVT family DNA-binding domain-containing protein [Paenibacillus kribbensis]|uniref:AbrB/MazE/SpoVT family DNA-binding domain-containing protein n=1 Tax=Paenibacillus kribbensis TaxID=172713 RepID=UPI0015BC672B|nr:AbrB/MazE/SpoVT family DNA-binding domain-containing protein [Paenibacillus kribbensis]